MNKMTQGEQRPVLRLFDRRPEHELQQHREKPIYRQEKALQSSLSLYFIKDSCDSRSFPSDCVWGPKWFLRGANCHFGENYWQTRGPQSVQFERQIGTWGILWFPLRWEQRPSTLLSTPALPTPTPPPRKAKDVWLLAGALQVRKSNIWQTKEHRLWAIRVVRCLLLERWAGNGDVNHWCSESIWGILWLWKMLVLQEEGEDGGKLNMI